MQALSFTLELQTLAIALGHDDGDAANTAAQIAAHFRGIPKVAAYDEYKGARATFIDGYSSGRFGLAYADADESQKSKSVERWNYIVRLAKENGFVVPTSPASLKKNGIRKQAEAPSKPVTIKAEALREAVKGNPELATAMEYAVKHPDALLAWYKAQIVKASNPLGIQPIKAVKPSKLQSIVADIDTDD